MIMTLIVLPTMFYHKIKILWEMCGLPSPTLCAVKQEHTPDHYKAQQL